MREEHLSDEQLAEALMGNPSLNAAAHIAECEACSAELARVSGAVGRVSEWTRAAGERPVGLWYAQRRAIAEQLGAPPQRSQLVAWAGALAVLVLAAVLLGQVSIDTGALVGNAKGAPETVQADPDDELMAEIQASGCGCGGRTC